MDMPIHRAIDVTVLPEAQLAVRLTFKESVALGEVAELKQLAGALITRLINLRTAAHSYSTIYDEAIGHVVTASMWAVLAATHEKVSAGG